MEFSEIEDLIIKKNIIKDLSKSSKEIYPLGSFDKSSNFPLGWQKDINVKDLSKSYKKLDKYRAGMKGNKL